MLDMHLSIPDENLEMYFFCLFVCSVISVRNEGIWHLLHVEKNSSETNSAALFHLVYLC